MRDFKRVAEVRATYHRKDQINVAKIKGSHTVNEYIRKIYPVPIELREAFLCLYLNVANNVQAYAIISVGGISSTTVDPKVIFQNALLCNASSIVLIHNHPSGALEPSNSDINLTEKLKKAGQVMDIPILDHLIIGAEGYYSFADNGLI